MDIESYFHLSDSDCTYNLVLIADARAHASISFFVFFRLDPWPVAADQRLDATACASVCAHASEIDPRDIQYHMGGVRVCAVKVAVPGRPHANTRNPPVRGHGGHAHARARTHTVAVMLNISR